MNINKVKTEYVRMACLSAVGRGIKFPSPEFEDYVAMFLNGLVETEDINVNEGLNPSGPRYL